MLWILIWQVPVLETKANGSRTLTTGTTGSLLDHSQLGSAAWSSANAHQPGFVTGLSNTSRSGSSDGLAGNVPEQDPLAGFSASIFHQGSAACSLLSDSDDFAANSSMADSTSSTAAGSDVLGMWLTVLLFLSMIYKINGNTLLRKRYCLQAEETFCSVFFSHKSWLGAVC
jgi:hypothetical protein